MDGDVRYDYKNAETELAAQSDSFDVEVNMNHHVEICGYGIVETPIIYTPRLGKKKLKIKHEFTIQKRIILENVKSKM